MTAAPTCEHCGYSFAGHYLGAAGITCPECGRHAKGRKKEDGEIPPLSWSVLPTLACFVALDVLGLATRHTEVVALMVLAGIVIPVGTAMLWAMRADRFGIGLVDRAGLAFVYTLASWAINFTLGMLNLAAIFALVAIFS